MAQNNMTAISRRNLLMKLGLAAGAAYVAPALAGLDVARASSGSGGGGGDTGGSSASGPSRSGGSGRSSGPSRPGGAARSSGPSRPGSGGSSTMRWRWDRENGGFRRVQVQR